MQKFTRIPIRPVQISVRLSTAPRAAPLTGEKASGYPDPPAPQQEKTYRAKQHDPGQGECCDREHLGEIRRHRAILGAVSMPGDGLDPPSEALRQQIETADADNPLRWPERVVTARRPTRCWT
ncbi:MAG: hypothetical protein WBG92_16465, partial [Thiohalocapsa sp.]